MSTDLKKALGPPILWGLGVGYLTHIKLFRKRMWRPATAALLSSLSLAAMSYYHGTLALVYLGVLAVGFGWLYLGVSREVRSQGVR